MESVGVNLIKTAALGRSFELGMLYDCRRDALIPGIRPWKIEEPNPNISSRPQINTRFKVTASDSIQDKSELLNIDGGMSLSVLGGLIEVSGAAKYLKDTKKSFIQQRLTLHYHATCEFKELFINHLPSLQNMPDNYNDTATHVVTGVLYGADAYFIFDRKVESDEDKTTVEGDLKVAFEKLKGISVNANVDLEMNDNQKNAVKKFTCTFYGDFQLQSNPTSFEDAMNIFAELPKLLKENQELAVPLRVWLYPLDKLYTRASKLIKDISMDLITKTESVIESLNTTEMKCCDIMEDSPARTFNAFHDKIRQMNKNCCTYKLRLVKKLGSLLPNIRGDVIKETALNDLLQEHNASPFRGSDLAEWLKDRERESEIMKSVLKQLIDAGAQVELNIDAIWMGLKDETLVSYTFTSLDWSDVLLSKQTGYLNPSTKEETDEKSPDSKQKSWLTDDIKKGMKRNLKMFETLINSKDSCKPAKFIVSSREMENHPGSCILLYESECGKAVCFTPPSRPALPVTEEVKGQTVVLKVPPSCPATVELRLLYKAKQDTVWTSEPVLKDQPTVTLTDLRAETEYEIKCAAVGKLNYTRDSDVIRVTTEQSERIGAVKEEGAETLKPNPKIPKNDELDTPVSHLPSRRIVLLGKSGVGKSTAGNTILGQKEFRSEMRRNSVTSECSVAQTTVSGRSVSVVDTPPFFDTQMKPEKLAEEIARSVYISSPGPHAFLIVFRVVDQFTEQEQQILHMIEMLFGQEVLKYSIILFTHGDQLEGQSVETVIERNGRLRDLVDQCGGRFHVFNNRDENNREQVNDLLQKIDSMIEQNGGRYYSHQMNE